MACLAAAAANHGATDLRLTTQRGIFVPLPDYRAARNLAGDLPAQAFVLLPDDPILSVAACVGAPACPRATTRVRHDARHLAFLASDAGTALHVSGCRKGCAHPRAAPVTLVGDRGFYDLVIDGKPSDSPSATGLTLDEAAAHLRQMAEQHARGGTV
jgi:sulfite reductase beta subunit-like hemoprotein